MNRPESSGNPFEGTNGSITCRGVRTHNLKDISVTFPRQKLIAVTGVSGSGKSSLVFDTLYAESQRRFIETLGTYERQFLEGLPEPEVDGIDNLPPAVALKQSNRATSPRALVSTSADLDEPLRRLFFELMEPTCSACGETIELCAPEDLLKAAKAMFAQGDVQVIALAVELPFSASLEAQTNLLNSLLSEGYLWVFRDSTLVRVEDLLKGTKENLNKAGSLIIDRIHAAQGAEEQQHRMEMAWSQVKFSPRFSELLLLPFDSDQHLLRGQTHLSVTPRCPRCQAPTTAVTAAHLDWKSPTGACATCHGLGNVPIVDPRKVIPDPDLPLSESAIKPWASQTFAWMQEAFLETLRHNHIDPEKTSYASLSETVRRFLWEGTNEKGGLKRISSDFVSLNDFFKRLEEERYKSSSRILSAKYRRYLPCPSCEGSRLERPGRQPKVAAKSIPEIMMSEASDVLDWLAAARALARFTKISSAAREAHDEAVKKLQVLRDLGLGSCQLWRRSRTLSGGEYQRVLIGRVLGSGLSDALYVLDEPSVGLGPTEIAALTPLLKEIRDLGNTVVVVDHDKSIISACDHWIELGPGGGHLGGKVMPSSGSLPSSCQVPATAEKSWDTLKIDTAPTTPSVTLVGFTALNCQQVDLTIPLGALTVLTGPSGAGKSVLATFGLSRALDVSEESGRNYNEDLDVDRMQGTWTNLLLPQRFFAQNEVISISQSPLHRSANSIVATVLDVLDPLRKQFAQTERAKAMDLGVSHFSFNSAGACQTCGGKGVLTDDLFFLGEVERDCPDCNRSRFAAKILQVQWNGRNIRDWLNLTIEQFHAEATLPTSTRRSVASAIELGLGYLPMSLSTTTLSGGEAQRLRIASRLALGEKKLFCIIDEPTRGLSEKDVAKLVGTLSPLTQKGHTFLVVEHHQQFLDGAHRVITMGPGSGRLGGKIVNIVAKR